MKGRNACLDESELRALADDAALADEREVWGEHLEQCATCQARFAQIRENAGAVAQIIDRLSPAEIEIDPAAAYQRWKTRVAHPGQLKGTSLMQRAFGVRRRAAMAGAALVAIMALVIAFAPVGTLAENVLNSFRVRQFAAITIPMDMVQQFAGMKQSITPEAAAGMAKELQSLGSFSTTLNAQSLHTTDSIDEARAHLGGTLLEPSTLPAAFDGTQPKIYLGDAGTAEYTMNVERVQNILAMLALQVRGLPDPQTTPTATFTLDVPDAAVLDYQAGDKHLLVGQMASPTLTIPSSVDVNELRDTILQIPGLPADLVGQLRAVKDWQHTLIVPVPAGATTSQTRVDGAPALLIEGQDGAGVLWQKGGILYGVAGQGLTGSEVMAVANSMK